MRVSTSSLLHDAMTCSVLGQDGAVLDGHEGLIDSDEPYVFTTLRWDSILEQSPENTAASCNRPSGFYMLEHHYTRLQVAKWGSTWYIVDRPGGEAKNGGLSGLLHQLSTAVKRYHIDHRDSPTQALRCKLRCYPSGTTATEVVSIPRLPLNRLFTHSFGHPDDAPRELEWTVAIDIQPTVPSEVTMFKTSSRACYARARAAADIRTLAMMKEVLLYSPENLLFDASISTPYAYRDGQWTTPASSCGGQQGATRRWALEHKLAVEGEIPIDSFRDGEVIWMSNGVRGFFQGRVVLRKGPSPELDETTVKEIEHQLHRPGLPSDYLPLSPPIH
nr:aminodeoxychorismate lyase [Quercus suber]